MTCRHRFRSEGQDILRKEPSGCATDKQSCTRQAFVVYFSEKYALTNVSRLWLAGNIIIENFRLCGCVPRL